MKQCSAYQLVCFFAGLENNTEVSIVQINQMSRALREENKIKCAFNLYEFEKVLVYNPTLLVIDEREVVKITINAIPNFRESPYYQSQSELYNLMKNKWEKIKGY